MNRLLSPVSILLLACLSACGSNAQQPAIHVPVEHPDLPLQGLDSRSAADATETIISGITTMDRSGNAVDAGTALQLNSAPGEPAWGIWQLNPGAEVLSGVRIELGSLVSGASAWLAVSNYSTGRWDFLMEIEQDTSIELDQVIHTSPMGNCFIALVTSGGDTVTVDSLVMLSNPIGWQVVTVDTILHVGAFCHLAEVAGAPAIAYNAEDALDEGDLKYARSTTSTGASAADWSQKVLVDIEGQSGYDPCLVVVDGNPAISFQADNDVLKYTRSTTPTGAEASDWSNQVVIDSDGKTGSQSSMAIVDGKPAIAYTAYPEPGIADLRYVISTTPDGSDPADWSPVVTVVSQGDAGSYPSLAVVADRPAISFMEHLGAQRALNYVRSETATGSAEADWGAPVTVIPESLIGNFDSLVVVDGNPAICFYDRSLDDMMFVRATSTTGALLADWPPAITVDAGGDVGDSSSMAIINGQPAISYEDNANKDLLYIRSMTASGDNPADWPPSPDLVDDAGNVGSFSSLAEINGRAAIAYYDSSNGDLKYAVLFE